MTYEEYLVDLRGAGSPVTAELDRIARQTVIAREVEAQSRLGDWLERWAGSITVITSEADAMAAVAQLKASGEVVGIDIETAKAPGFLGHPLAGLRPEVSRIRLVQLFVDKDSGVIIIDCFSAGYAWLKCLVGGHYVAHNAHFECSHFWHRLKTPIEIDCTMLAGRVFHGELRKLSELAEEHLELRMSKALQVSDWSRPNLLDEQLQYAAADAVAAKLLWEKFEVVLFESDPKYQGAYRFLKALVYPVIRQAGICFDLKGHAMVVAKWEAELKAASLTLAELGLENPASVKQKQRWLNEHLGEGDLLDWPRTECGNLSTSAEVLDQAVHIPGASPLARWSQLSTRVANFGHKLAEMVIEGCLYPNYRIGGMVTGRFGCGSPNIQNQPRTGFKHLYWAPDGCQFVTGDLSQIELRVVGLISGDQVINDAYERGCDLHREVAAQRAGKDQGDVTKAERQAAKAINFGLIFGAGARTLRQQAISSYGVDMSMEDAEQAKVFFRGRYSRLSEWQKEVVADANALGFSESPHIKLTRHYSDRVYTHAMNFPVQSGAWEVLALAIIYVDKNLPADGSIRISHHVYDELCLVARDDQVMTAALLLRDGFKHGFKNVFPDGSTRGLVEIGAGSTWEEAASDDHRIEEASL